MKKINFCYSLSFLYVVALRTEVNAQSSYSLDNETQGACGDWETYEDKKCFKLLGAKGLLNYDDASVACKEKNGSLISIGSKREDDIITRYLSDQEVANSVWLGGKRRGGDFFWEDGSDIKFANWSPSNPSDAKNRECLQISLFLSSPAVNGLAADAIPSKTWTNVPCLRGNLILCQKNQQWSLEHVINKLVSYREQHEQALFEMKTQQEQTLLLVKKQEQQLALLALQKEAQLPIGFIYVQLPGQAEPQDLWTATNWTDVTTDYAGLFFRAEGGASAAFGTEQADTSPRLTHVEASAGPKGSYCSGNCAISASGIRDHWIQTYTQYFAGTGNVGILGFTVSSVEVRPRNKAVRIWKRESTFS